MKRAPRLAMMLLPGLNHFAADLLTGLFRMLAFGVVARTGSGAEASG